MIIRKELDGSTAYINKIERNFSVLYEISYEDTNGTLIDLNFVNSIEELLDMGFTLSDKETDSLK